MAFWNSEKEISLDFYKREPLSVDQNIVQLRDVAAKSSIHEKTAVDGCERCNKRGLSFLPVRYAVGELKYFDKYSLPKDKICDFTTIDLKQQIDSDGNFSKRKPINCYFLRKLRKGYLYVYDEHPQVPLWQCYAVSNYGELNSFPVNNPIPLEKIQEMKDCASGFGHPARSSLVSLRDSHLSRPIYLMFLEIPLSQSRLEWIAENEEWRIKNMQSFDVVVPEYSKFYFEKKEILKYVPEYDDESSPYWTFQDQIWQGRYHNALESSKSRSLRMDTYESLSFHMDDIHCSNNVQRKGFMYALNDEVGIIEQLDVQRVNPLLTLKSNILPEDTKVPGLPDNQTLNERNYKWYLAVLQCKKIMDGIFTTRESDVNENFRMPGYDKTYKEAKEELLNSQTEEYKNNFSKLYLDCDKYINGDKETQKAMREKVDYMYEGHVSEIRIRKVGGIEDYWNYLRKKEISRVERAKKEIEDYCVGEDWKSISDAIGPYHKDVEENSPLHDCDYSLWVKNYLHKALDRYDKYSFFHGGYISKIIFDCLRHGIVSVGSMWLLKNLSEMKDEGNILLRGYTLNFPEIIDEEDLEYIISYNSKKEDDDKKRDSAASRIYKALKFSLNQYLKADNKNPFRVNEGLLISYAKSVEKLYEVNIYSQTTLWMEEINRKILDGKIVPVSIRASVNVKMPRLYGLVNSVSDLLKNNSLARLKTKTFRITLAELYSLSNALYEKNIDASYGTEKAFSGYREMGVFGVNKPSFKSQSKVWAEVTLTTEDNIMNEICKSQSSNSKIKINGSLAEMYITDYKAFEKAYVGSFNKTKMIGLKSFILFGFIMSINELSKDIKDLDAWWKGMTTFLGLVQASLEAVSWRYTSKTAKIFSEEGISFASTGTTQEIIRRFEQGNSNTMSKFGVEETAGYIINARMCGLVAEGISYLIMIMGVYNLLKNTIEIQEMKRKGALSKDILLKSISNCVEFIGGVVVGITMSIFFVSACIAIVLFALLSYLSADRVVPECIQMWIRRSKFGKEKNTALGRPFHNMEDEQNALYSIIKGVLISTVIENKDRKFMERNASNVFYGVPLSGGTQFSESKSTAPIEEYKDISFCISVPCELKGVLDVEVASDKKGVMASYKSTIFMNYSDSSKYIALEEIENDIFSFDDNPDSKIELSNTFGAEFKGSIFSIGGEDGEKRQFNINKIKIDKSVVVDSDDKFRRILLKRHCYLNQMSEGAILKFSLRISCENNEVISTVFEEPLVLE